MSDRPDLAREQLQANWLDWVRANLGTDPSRAQLAGNAAVDAVTAGKSLSVASTAAANAWTQAGGRPPSWRFSFWGLLVVDRFLVASVVVLAAAQALWFARGGLFTILLDLLLAPYVVIAVSDAYRLSRVGVLAPGVLAKTKRLLVGRNTAYVATYEFDHHGPHFVTRVAPDTPQEVLVLLDPSNPTRARVVPMQLSTA